MPRPLNKTQLLAACQKEYTALEKLLAPLTSEQLSHEPKPGGWAIKDILAHLMEWQQMFFIWFESGLRGEIPATPAPGYKWNQLPALNQSIYEKHRALSPGQSLALWRESRQKTLLFIENLTDADLVTPGLYEWMNQHALMAYLNANTAAHYAWARKDIKKILNG